MVALDAHDLIRDTDANSIRNYTWISKDVRLNTNEGGKYKSILSFRAPYIKGDDLNSNLRFELTITDKDGKTRNPPYSVDVIVKRVQRAIIFQGGVALGAYEAGVYRAIVDKLLKNNEHKKGNGLDRGDRPLFDIVAGTSIGAMNGAIVVSSVTDKGKDLGDPKNWEDLAGQVTEFWWAQRQLPTIADFLDMNRFYHDFLDALHNASVAIFTADFRHPLCLAPFNLTCE